MSETTGKEAYVRIAFCDDDDNLRAELRGAVELLLEKRNLPAYCEEYVSGSAMLARVAERPFDLIFLDIYLGSEDGLSIARALRKIDSVLPLVFMTVSRDYAVESYEVHACDYLVKPIEEAAIARVLDRVLPLQPSRLAFRTKGSHRYFAFNDIMYIESRDHAVLLHTSSGECCRGLAKLDDVMKELDDPRFLRCHRSCIVNMDHIADVRDDFILRDGTCVPVRVKERRHMHDVYYRYFVDSACDDFPISKTPSSKEGIYG